MHRQGVSAFGIRGWTTNFGLSISIKEEKEFNALQNKRLQRYQTKWKNVMLLMLDEKSMVGCAQMGYCDKRLRQAFPTKAAEILSGTPK